MESDRKIQSTKQDNYRIDELLKENRDLKHKLKMLVMYPEHEETIEIYFEILNEYEKRT